MALILLFAFAALIGWTLVLAAATAGVESQALIQRQPNDYASPKGQRYGVPQIEESTPDLSKDYELLDVVLVASIDGKFHALNRTSGHTLWSMSSFATTTSVSAPSSLSPLVRTTHPQHDPDLIDDDDSEQSQHDTYIIEPQSGDIYVLHSPTAPLQRFPFSMSELVDISPFTSVNKDDTKVFVGRKETSLLLIELETGRIKATLNAECPFIPDESDESPVDLDELEGSKPPISAPTEVYIGRTDYHIVIHKKPLPGKPTPPVQELSFSTYGPNNKDNHLQSIYRRTHDDTYIQSLPNGEIIAFRTKNNDSSAGKDRVTGAFWGRPFPAPIVAIFDVLKPVPSLSAASHRYPVHPFVLLQPRPKLQDLFPNIDASNAYRGQLLPNLGSAYVGIVEETGSLFVLSPDRYPLVVFGGNEKHGLGAGEGATGERGKGGRGKVKALDPPRDMGDSRLPQDDDDADDTETEVDPCVLSPYDARCLVGIRPLEDNDGIEGRWKRLLDGPKAQTPAAQQPMDNGSGDKAGPVVVGRPWDGPVDGDNGSNSGSSARPVLAIDGHSQVPHPDVAPPTRSMSGLRALLLGSGPNGDEIASSIGGVWEGIIVTLLFGSLTLWFMWNKVKGRWKGETKSKRTAHVSEPTGQKTDLGGTSGAKAVAEELAKVQIVGDAIADVDQEGKVEQEQAVAPVPEAAVEVPSAPKEKLASILVNGDARPNGAAKSRKDSLAFAIPPDTPRPGTPSANAQTPVPGTPTPNSSGSGGAIGGDEGDESDGEGEGDLAAAPGKRKSRRGKRGKKKKPGVVAATASSDGTEKKEEPEKEEEKKLSSSLVLTTSSPKPPVVQQPSLVVSDTILGFGSHGTVVFQGSLQGRAVAVKRLLQDFVTLASREVSILQESDDHPNVIRYYYQESHGNFLYIALELCPASLADIIESPDREAWRDIAINFDPKKALKQIASGLRHLHALKLVHRDIKPQNILVSASSSVKGGFGARAPGAKAYRMLISDFGLCKKLDMDQTSFLPTAHGALGAGTVGWRAPEILRGEVKLDEFSNGDESLSSRGSVATVHGSSSGGGPTTNTPTRLTKSVDIFALGCLFYYTLTNGGHPYGDRFEREVNIMRDAKDLTSLERFGEEGTEATDLINAMLCPEASGRPDTTTILLHPFFWDPGRRLNFLQDASDRFEIMCRDPRDAHLLTLEKNAQRVVGNDWHSRLDKIFIENLGRYRKYDGKSVQDLMRALRNKKHHYQDLPDNVKRHLGPMPEGFLGYFTRRYPQLFLHVHGVVKDTGLHTESMFRTYFELPDS